MNRFTCLFFLAASVTASTQQTGYAPIHVDCPPDLSFVRPASDGLSTREAAWTNKRKGVVTSALADYLSRLSLTDFCIDTYIASLHASNYTATPTIGFAISGGGWASSLTGTGALRALDARLNASNDARTGGLLQSMTYLSGQSGGGWVPMSFATSNFQTADELLEYWQPQIDRFSATTDTIHAAKPETMYKDVGEKAKAGFNVSLADYLGRVVGYEFVEGYRGGVNTTFSSVTKLSNFRDAQMPLPILQASEVIPGDKELYGVEVPNLNSTVDADFSIVTSQYELTPFEFGSWQGSAEAFTPMEYLGTRVENGRPVNQSACVKGFDSVDFLLGTTAQAFGFWYIEDKSNNTQGLFPKRSISHKKSTKAGVQQHTQLVRRIADQFPPALVEGAVAAFKTYFNLSASDISYAWYPNPFRNTSCSPGSIDNKSDLRLVDNTEIGTALPLAGQLARNATFIMTWDDNTDALPYGWQNGTNLYNAYREFKAKGVAFPVVPNPSTFIANNYTTKPAFFGCDANLTTKGDLQAPIIAWFASAPYSSYSNYSFFQSNTSIPRVRDIWVNSFNLMTQGNGTLDDEWPNCLGCAAIDRSLSKLNPPMKRTSQCERCFARYCWDGVSVSGSVEPEIVDPALVLNPSESYADWYKEVGEQLIGPS